MKKIYKINITILSLFVLFFATQTFAASPFDRTSIFCSEWNEIDAKISSKITERETMFETKKENRITDLGSKWAEIDAKREAKRLEADTVLSTQIASLNTKATTDAQRQAIANYETSVKNALEVRRVAIDEIIKDYRSNINTAIENRNEIAGSAVDEFKASVNSAISDISAQCENDVSTRDIRENLKSAMEQARENLKNTIKSQDPKTSIEIYETQTSEKMKIVQEQFKSSLETARIELKQAFE